MSVQLGSGCEVGWAGRGLLVLLWLSVWDSVCIVLLRRGARRRPFRFISVWVAWVLLSSALYGFVASRPAR